MTVPSTPGSAGFDWFRRFSQRVARSVGAPWAFAVALIVVVGWAITGPVFHYSNTWQLIINTCTTIITFLMVFVIQNTQNRDSQVTQLKLDELIRATNTARNRLLDMDTMSDAELAQLQKEFKELHRRAGEALEERRQADRRATPPGNSPVGTKAGESGAPPAAAAAGVGKMTGQD